MAPLVDKSTGPLIINEEDKKNLWSQILHDVQKNGNPKLSPHKQILVLGDNESGKTTMVAKLQGIFYYRRFRIITNTFVCRYREFKQGIWFGIWLH